MLAMVVKDVCTHDPSSYSLSSLLLTNLGDAVHSLDVHDPPAGPA